MSSVKLRQIVTSAIFVKVETFYLFFLYFTGKIHPTHVIVLFNYSIILYFISKILDIVVFKLPSSLVIAHPPITFSLDSTY